MSRNGYFKKKALFNTGPFSKLLIAALFIESKMYVERCIKKARHTFLSFQISINKKDSTTSPKYNSVPKTNLLKTSSNLMKPFFHLLHPSLLPPLLK